MVAPESRCFLARHLYIESELPGARMRAALPTFTRAKVAARTVAGYPLVSGCGRDCRRARRIASARLLSLALLTLERGFASFTPASWPRRRPGGPPSRAVGSTPAGTRAGDLTHARGSAREEPAPGRAELTPSCPASDRSDFDQIADVLGLRRPLPLRAMRDARLLSIISGSLALLRASSSGSATRPSPAHVSSTWSASLPEHGELRDRPRAADRASGSSSAA